MKTAVVQAPAVEHLLGNSELLKLLLLWTGIPSPGPLHDSLQGCQEESPAGMKESEILSILTHSLRNNGGAIKLTCGLGPLSGVGHVTHPLCYNSISMTINVTGENVRTPSTQNLCLIEVRSLLLCVIKATVSAPSGQRALMCVTSTSSWATSRRCNQPVFFWLK